MTSNMIPALLIGSAIIVAAALGATTFALSHRYSTEVARGAIVRTNHLTGEVLVCSGPGACVRWVPRTGEDAAAEAVAAVAN